MSEAVFHVAPGAGDHPVRVALAAAAGSVQAARSAAVWSLSDDDLAAALVACEMLAARVAELGLALVREADGADVGRRSGASSTAAWLRHRLRLRPGEARARIELAHRVRAADDIAPDDAEALDDEAAAADWAATVSAGPPGRGGAMPVTGAALRAGSVSADHARVIAWVLGKIPARVADGVVADAEARLAGWAVEYDPATLQNLGRHLLMVLDPDGTLLEDEDEARRELRINPDTGAVRGRLDREGIAQVLAALDPLAAPCPAADGTPDPRSAARRIADALVELLAGPATAVRISPPRVVPARTWP